MSTFCYPLFTFGFFCLGMKVFLAVLVHGRCRICVVKQLEDLAVEGVTDMQSLPVGRAPYTFPRICFVL